MINERLQPLRIFALVNDPIAEAGDIAVAEAKPAVIEHETLDPKPGRRIGLGFQGVQFVIKVIAFPGVERDRAWPHRSTGPVENAAAHKGWES